VRHAAPRPAAAYIFLINSIRRLIESVDSTGAVRSAPALADRTTRRAADSIGLRDDSERDHSSSLSRREGAMTVLGALLAVGVNAQVPVPNARQLDFMELELTQFM